MKNIFYSLSDKKKKRNFDEYSKTPDDIYSFYQSKYPEVDIRYKMPYLIDDKFFSKIKDLDKSNSKQFSTFISSIDKPFELFILAFIFHMQEKLLYAESCFNKSLCLIRDNFCLFQYANKAMIKLQLSQLYDKMNKRKESIQMLFSIVHEFKNNEEFLSKYNNLLASAYMRIGVYIFREYKKFNLSQYTIFLSIKYRKKYRNHYSVLDYKQYLSTAFRNYALTLDNVLDTYLLLKKSLEYRFFVMDNTSDEFNKAEAIYTLFDLLRFLISKHYKNGLIVKYSRILYKIICSTNNDTRKLHAIAIFQYSLMLSKYFFSISDPYNSTLWHKTAKYISDNKKDFSIMN